MENMRVELFRTAGGMLHTTLMVGSGLLLVVSERAVSRALNILSPVLSHGKVQASEPTTSVNETVLPGLKAFLHRFLVAEGVGKRFSNAGVVLVQRDRVTLGASFGRLREEAQPPEVIVPPLQGTESITGAFPTAADMGSLIISLLVASGEQALPASGTPSRRPIYRQQFLQHPPRRGPVYEFLETTVNGRRALCHVGGRDHRSLLYLLPGERTAFYVVVEGGDEQTRFRVTTRLAQKLMDRMFPEPVI